MPGLLLAILLAGCATEQPEQASEPAEDPVKTMETRADSVALMAYSATGGDAWNDVRYLRFDFAVESAGERGPSRRHLWDRTTGDYRIEWPAAGDTTVVVLFNVSTREGSAFLEGSAADPERAAQILASAYSRHINDTYWLMAPQKVFDPGVKRTYAADSSSAGVEVLRLEFDNVGLTPGDRYWMKIDPATGDLAGWTYILEGSPDRTSTFRWTEYRTFEKPEGSLRLSERKEAVGRALAILTDRVSLPSTVPPDVFSNPAASME